MLHVYEYILAFTVINTSNTATITTAGVTTDATTTSNGNTTDTTFISIVTILSLLQL